MFSIRFSAAVAVVMAMAAAAQTSVTVAPESEPNGALTLEQVLSLATSRNPEIAAAASEVRAREGRRLQAGTRPNPELSGTTENLGGDKAKTGGVQSTVQVGQRLELGGDREARTAAARAARDLAGWDLESRRLDVAGRATRAFIDVLSAQRRVELADDAAAGENHLRVEADRLRLVGQVIGIDANAVAADEAR